MAVRIYVDQGHNPGNINAGASGNGVVESEVTYWVGIYLAGFLYADQRFEVKVSRPFPDTVLGYDQASSLRARVDEANAWPADYFVSIHVNSNPNPAINGSEVYVYRENSTAYDPRQLRIHCRSGGNTLQSGADQSIPLCSAAYTHAGNSGGAGVSFQSSGCRKAVE